MAAKSEKKPKGDVVDLVFKYGPGNVCSYDALTVAGLEFMKAIDFFWGDDGDEPVAKRPPYSVLINRIDFLTALYSVAITKGLVAQCEGFIPKTAGFGVKEMASDIAFMITPGSNP